jgi:hypothetical protein
MHHFPLIALVLLASVTTKIRNAFLHSSRHVTKMRHFPLIALVLLASVAIIRADDPSYTTCLDTKDCAAAQCCVLGGVY